MKYVKPMTEAERLTLEELFKNHENHRTRIRGHGMLLSQKGYTIDQICSIYDMQRDSVSRWINKWENEGIIGLLDEDRSGRPSKLTEEECRRVLEYVQENAKSIKQVIAKVEEIHKKKVSRDTIKRIVKKAKMIWKRVRTSLRSKRDAERFALARIELMELNARQERGEIDLYYGDESGFSLIPKIPYAWQKIGEHIELACARSRSLNVFGLVQKNGNFESVLFEQTIDSNMVIAYFDQMSDRITKETWVILDNSAIHKAKRVLALIPIWKAKGLNLYFLPPYCPELNLIEIVWRFIKYHWLPVSAYLSIDNLKQSLFTILANIGISYNITFA